MKNKEIIKKAFENDPEVFDPKLYMPTAIEYIKEVLKSKLKICYRLK